MKKVKKVIGADPRRVSKGKKRTRLTPHLDMDDSPKKKKKKGKLTARVEKAVMGGGVFR